MVVDRPQVGLVAEMGGHLDLVEHTVERAARVHERERLCFERLEQLGGVGERGLHAVGAEDREAVPGEQRLGAEPCHLPERTPPSRDA